jgi:flagellar assembly protein FliH
MSDIILKIPRSTSSAKVKVVEEYNFDNLSGSNSKEIRLQDKKRFASMIEARKRQQTKKVIFTEKFVVSSSNQPVQISLKKVSEPTLSIADAKIEIQSAYDKGFADGQEASEISYQNEIQKYKEWINRIDSVSKELRSDYTKQIDSLEQVVLPTAIVIAKHILGAELTVNPELVLSQVKKAVAMAEEDTIFKIFCHPEDVEILNLTDSYLTANKSNGSKIEILSDNSITKGGCILQTSAGIIDASIESQLQRIMESLEE